MIHATYDDAGLGSLHRLSQSSNPLRAPLQPSRTAIADRQDTTPPPNALEPRPVLLPPADITHSPFEFGRGSPSQPTPGSPRMGNLSPRTNRSSPGVATSAAADPSSSKARTFIFPSTPPRRRPPQDTDEEFLENVRRLVENTADSGSDERTPSPFIGVDRRYSPSTTPDVALAHQSHPDRITQLRREGDSRVRPGFMGSVSPKSRSSPELPPANIARPDFQIGESPSRSARGPNRITRSRDAKELERAIAAVQALEAQSKFDSCRKPSVKGKEKQSNSNNSHHRSSTQTAQISSPTLTHGRVASSETGVSESQASVDKEVVRHLPPGARVGVAMSPMKGRRLKLLRPNSGSRPQPLISAIISPAFQRWLQTPSTAPVNPTPPNDTVSSISATADWSNVDLAALGITFPPPTASADRMLDRNIKAAERELRKRKRLDAFSECSSESSADEDPATSSAASSFSRDTNESSRSSSPLKYRIRTRRSPLKPALVEGLGRMAIDPADLLGASVAELPSGGNRPTWRKSIFGREVEADDSLMLGVETGGAGLQDLWRQRPSDVQSGLNRSEGRGEVGSLSPLSDSSPALSVHTGWPDVRYPWSVNEHKRKRRRREDRFARLTAVETFLSRESDTEDEVDHSLSFVHNHALSNTPHAPFLKTTSTIVPRHSDETITQSFQPAATGSSHPNASFYPSISPLLQIVNPTFGPPDPADARAALASRRDVRSALILSSRRQEEEEQEEDINCVCGGLDDGRAMVRCDGCKTWSHQPCVGIRDESELEEHWYCAQCQVEVPSFASRQQDVPTLVETDFTMEKPGSSAGRNPFIGASADCITSSQFLPQRSPFRAPMTPKSRRHLVDTPSTLFHARTYNQSRPAETQDADVDGIPLDQITTPSRGTKYGPQSFPTPTPKLSRHWTQDPVFATPRPAMHNRWPVTSPQKREPGSSTSTLRGDATSTSPPQHPYNMMSQYLDTPIQRTASQARGLGPAFNLESPTRPRSSQRQP